MSKIISLVLLAVMSSTLCHSGFLVATSNQVATPSFPEAARDVEQFSLGFYSGLAIFNNLPHQAACMSAATDAETFNTIVDIVNQLRSLNKQSDFVAVFKTVANDVKVLVAKYENATTSCRAMAGEFEVVYTQLVAYLSNSEYVQKATQHAMFNIGAFTQRFEKIVATTKAQSWNESGVAIGDLINFALFWDFKPKF